jgi:hypothetical protein
MRIFVGGLPRTATKDEVVRLFRQFGAGDDDVVLPRDRRTRRRKGFAYVEIADEARARAAIATFAEFAIEGKLLTVCAADERPAKRPRRKFAIVLAFLAAGLHAAAPAYADEPAVRLGLTLNPIIGGIHESYDDRVRVPPVPIPLLEVRAAYGPFEIDLEGLPPLSSVRYNDTLQGTTSTRLSIFNGVARVWDPLHRFSFGLGQTLYNQSTHYTQPVEIPGTGETQFSRVTGITYQAGYSAPFRRGRFEAVFDYAPALVGTQYTLYDRGFYRGRIDPERADQIDTAIRYVRPSGNRGEFILGLRYVNYTAAYAERNGGLSDRNVGLLPVFGYLTRVGRTTSP